tara:strand:+ start:1099 stop:1788 length:690 start_codon:yes stop_codon:yes gene_type:complete
MKLKKIRVYGKLRKFLGQSYFEAAVKSPADAIKFLLCNFPEVEAHMYEQMYKIKMNNLEVETDFLNIKGSGDIQIIPVATGSTFVIPFIAGVGSTVATVASTVATVATTVGSAVVAGVTAVGSAIGTVAAGIAAEYGTTGILGTLTTMAVNTLAIEGVTALIAPTPAPFEGVDSDGSVDAQMAGSYSFSGVQNTAISGVAVPIIYGEVFTGSIVISSGIDTVQVEGTLT